MADPDFLSKIEFDEVMTHLDFACTLMKMCIMPLYDPEDSEKIRGFVLAPMEYFTGDLELKQSDGVWESQADRPSDPKKLN